MENQELTKLFSTQISLSEWLQSIGHEQAEAFRQEDKRKHDRLTRLRALIGLPFDEPTSFPAAEVLASSPAFTEWLDQHGGELCALRLIPLNPELPKLRMRGKSVRNAVDWLHQQAIEPAHYRADFLPHDDNSTWATIFIVNQEGMFGEITHGLHSDLTQGQYESHLPNSFCSDFLTWKFARPDPEAQAHLEKLTGMILVDDPPVRKRLEQELGSKFTRNFLNGYFETTDSTEFGVWFKDYNRILAELYADVHIEPLPCADPAGSHLLTGQTGSPGRATGRVRVIDGPQAFVQPDDVLVCRMTTPDYLPLMQQAAAIVTDLGGVLSHAAIVARELGKPCLTATGCATTVLLDGQLVEVDADAGVVRLA